jgi:hypothetical protein
LKEKEQTQSFLFILFFCFQVLEWSIPLIDSETPDGALEFVVANLSSTANLFPIEVTFTADYIVCSIDALAAAGPDGSEVQFSKKASISTENYKIVSEGE